ncbi:MAG TPA: M1 family metallopeptidase [Bacteroidia bacterium]
MKLFFSSFFMGFITLNLLSQNTLNQVQWQQRSNHTIVADLDTSAHKVVCHMKWTYFNHSPYALTDIKIHLYPNAYKDNNTAFAKQMLKNNKIDFYHSKPKDKGKIDVLKTVENGKNLTLTIDSINPDIGNLRLNEELKPGDSIHIVMDYVVTLPKLFSRSGYSGAFYSVTQWYPKPAVLDVKGWNQMSYLDQGEFYSEFGNYTVEISVPKGYLVASAGNLLSDTIIGEKRKLIFKENNIHDFAWFASPHLRLVSDTATLENGRKVKLELYHDSSVNTRMANESIINMKRTIEFYSAMIGNYPYSSCKMVIGDLKAGEGMEYPTIAICAHPLIEAVVHEVGHNWFYGILASNERSYPWMDESVNSYFERLLCEKKEVKRKKEILPDQKFFSSRTFDMLNKHPLVLNLLQLKSYNLLQPLNLESESYTSYNYGHILYGKGPLAFAYLNQVLGDSLFSACFKTYFETWKYKHPLPNDMKQSFEKASGTDLTWFFGDVLSDNAHIDVIRSDGKYEVKGSEKLSQVFAKDPTKNPNSYGFLFEKNFRNNGHDKKLIKIAFPFGVARMDRKINISCFPVLGYNYYDKMYVGLGFTNSWYNTSKFKYMLMPSYSFKTSKLLGYGFAKYTFPHERSVIRNTSIGVEGKSYGMSVFSRENSYFKVNPYLKFEFRNSPKSNPLQEQYLIFDFYHTGLRQQDYKLTLNDSLKTELTIRYPANYFMNYFRGTYHIDNRSALNRLSFTLSAEAAKNYKYGPGDIEYIKTWVNLGYKHQYNTKKKYFRSRVFGGYFVSSKGNYSKQKFFITSNNGGTDYLYNDFILGRSENITGHMAVGRYFNGPGLRTNLITNDCDRWMLTMKNDIDFPGILPFRLYADFGTYSYVESVTSNTGTTTRIVKPELYYVMGIELHAIKNTLEIFIPFVQSKQFINPGKSAFMNSIGFRLNINQFDPGKLIKRSSIDGKSDIGEDL